MIYTEKEEKQGNRWLSFCRDNLGAKYDQWLVPVRILEISPAEFAKLLVNEFNATLRVYKNNYTGFWFLGKSWDTQADAIKWRNYINQKARERGFHI